MCGGMLISNNTSTITITDEPRDKTGFSRAVWLFVPKIYQTQRIKINQ